MIDDEVRLMGLDLAVGEQGEPALCPFCKATHERKFSVRRTTEGILYNCFRGKCGARGFIPIGGGYSLGVHKETPYKKVKEPYDATKLRPCRFDDDDFFLTTWGIKKLKGRVFVTPEDEYAFRITDEAGFTRGWHIRQPKWKGVTCHRYGQPSAPKGMTYKDSPENRKLAWFVGKRSGGALVLVEDYISAMKINQLGYNVVCLFGTALGDKDRDRIRTSTVQPDEVVVWLDADATNEAYNMVNRYGVSLNMRVICTDRDPKDVSNDTIRELI